MMRVVAIGDVHARFDLLWEALVCSGCAQPDRSPSAQLLQGELHLVLIGDLVHPKTPFEYAQLAAVDSFDARNPQHLQAAARAECLGLQQLMQFSHRAAPQITLLLGNHDHAALYHQAVLGNSLLDHLEFDPRYGGLALPPHLATWMASFPLEFNLLGVNFAHVGPTSWLQSYDDYFYATDEHRSWALHNPEYVTRSGYRYGVYGHVVQPEGITLYPQLALIDALPSRQYLELWVDTERVEPQVRSF